MVALVRTEDTALSDLHDDGPELPPPPPGVGGGGVGLGGPHPLQLTSRRSCCCSAIVKHLLAKHGQQLCITVFDAACKPGPHLLSGVAYIRGDITQQAHLAKALEGADCVLHTASLIGGVLTPPSAIEHVNVEGAQNVLLACKQHGIKCLVYSSSCECTTHACLCVWGGGGVASSRQEVCGGGKGAWSGGEGGG